MPSPAGARSMTWQTAAVSSSPAMTMAPGLIWAESRASSRKVQTYPVWSSSLRSAVMSTRYIAALLMSASFSRVLGVWLDVTEGGKQACEFDVGGPAEADREVRPLAGRQQVEAVT